jgi:two-component system CheB/CheR fusion protein
LGTVNSELQAKVLDRSHTNNEMKNLLAGTDIGMIFVNHQLHVQRFTPAVNQMINLIPSDEGGRWDISSPNLSGMTAWWRCAGSARHPGSPGD